MKLKEEDLTVELLKELFTYHEDGYLIWNIRPLHHFNNVGNCKRFNTPCAGNVAGYFNKRSDSQQEGFGYWRTAVSLKGLGFEGVAHFKTHRLIFAMHHGYFPEVVDHIDGDTNNNRINNLRPCSIKENSRNLKNAVNNTTGYKGVLKTNRIKNPYSAIVHYEGRGLRLGVFSTKEEAAAAYNLVSRHLFGEYYRPNDVDFKEDNVSRTSKFFKDYFPKILLKEKDWINDFKIKERPIRRKKNDKEKEE